MEFPTIDASAKLAKRELHSDYFPRDYISKSELLARLTPPAWASLSPKELHARFAATLDAARVPWERGKDRTNIVDGPDDDDDLAPVPAPLQPVAVPRRQRKRSLATVLAAARKAGANHVTVDGAVIALSPAVTVPESTVTDPDANEWDTVLPEGDHGPH